MTNAGAEWMRGRAEWRLARRSVVLGERTLVMGVVNITPDSFSDGGRFAAPEQAVEHGLRLLDEGADLLDLGAESTRPGSKAGLGAGYVAVSAGEEQARLLPVLEGLLRARPGALLSVDTYKAATARAALLSGAEIVNDVSGFLWDGEMAGVCAESRCGVVLMHTRGRPDEWGLQPRLAAEAVLPMVLAELGAVLESAVAAGVTREAIVLDPGYGFGKRFGENFALMRGQRALFELGRPLLVGVSRKSFLTKRLEAAGVVDADGRVNAGAREVASIAALVGAILAGASVVRVHEAGAARAAAAIADAHLPDH